MNMAKRFTTVGIFAVASAALLAGCEQPDWTSPEYVGKQILSDDLIEQRTAIQKVGDLPEADQIKVLPQLIQVYNKGGANQKEAMQLIVQFRDASAKDVYLSELETNATEYAGASAEALGEAGVKDAVPKMLEILKSTDKNDVKVGIIQAFGYMPTKEMVPPLIEILKLDVDTNPIQLHAYACEVLGNLAVEDKSAINDAALQQITLAVFYGNMAGQSLDSQCGLAIQQIGEPAIPELIKVFKGEREDVQKLMMKYDSPKASFPRNRPKLIAAKRLGSLRASSAVEPFLGFLGEEKKAPDTLEGQKAVDWRVTEGQITSEVLRSLGDIGGDKQAEMLIDVLEGEYIETEWDEITAWSEELQFRQDAGFALNALGHRPAVKNLLNMADNGVLVDMEKRFAMVEASGEKPSEVQRYQFNWMSFRTAAMLSDGSDVDAFESLTQKTSKKYPDLGAKMGEFLPAVKLAAECMEKGDDAAKAKCFAAKLVDNMPAIREKAAFELGRLPVDVARPIILENLDTDFLDTREILAFNLYRMPDTKVVEKINQILEEEANKGGEYKLDHYRLKLLRAYAKNQSK